MTMTSSLNPVDGSATAAENRGRCPLRRSPNVRLLFDYRAHRLSDLDGRGLAPGARPLGRSAGDQTHRRARTTLGRPGARTPVARDCDPAGPRHSVLAHLSPEQLRTSRLRGTPTVPARRRDSRNWGPPSRAALGPGLRPRGGAGRHGLRVRPARRERAFRRTQPKERWFPPSALQTRLPLHPRRTLPADRTEPPVVPADGGGIRGVAK